MPAVPGSFLWNMQGREELIKWHYRVTTGNSRPGISLEQGIFIQQNFPRSEKYRELSWTLRGSRYRCDFVCCSSQQTTLCFNMVGPRVPRLGLCPNYWKLDLDCLPWNGIERRVIERELSKGSGRQRLREEKWRDAVGIVMSVCPSWFSVDWKLINNGINKEIFYLNCLKVAVALFSNFNLKVPLINLCSYRINLKNYFWGSAWYFTFI